MKQSDITISEVKLVYRTRIKAPERIQVKTSKDAFEIFGKSEFQIMKGFAFAA
jgi:hypothetical protein